MRALHTSDWHLGRTFHGGQLISEQTEMVDAIVALAIEHSVDAVIIAGDLFDRAIPSVEAVELWESAVRRLRATGAVVIAIAGNHDSARRVSVHAGLLEAGGVVIRGSLNDLATPYVVERSGAAPVAIYAVPYLDPVLGRGVFGDDAFEALPDDVEVDPDNPPRRRVTHRSITRAATDRIRADLDERGRPASIVVAHTFVSGGEPSESERDITLGNVENVPLSVFDDFTYVALGHLHGPQAFAGGRITYSGSPLPYSFSEERHHKSVRLVTIPDEPAADGTFSADVETIELDLSMRLTTLTGTLVELLDDPAHEPFVNAYVRAYLTDVRLPLNAMADLRTRFANAVELRHRPHGTTESSDEGVTALSERRDAPPIELAAAFFTEFEHRDFDDEEAELVRSALEYALGGER